MLLSSELGKAGAGSGLSGEVSRGNQTQNSKFKTSKKREGSNRQIAM